VEIDFGVRLDGVGDKKNIMTVMMTIEKDNLKLQQKLLQKLIAKTITSRNDDINFFLFFITLSTGIYSSKQ
jgi:hypothetical protein